jgi:hypothetical protein
MADQRSVWNFDALGDDFESAGNDNLPQVPLDAFVVKNINPVKQSLIDGARNVGESQECVALVKHVIPEIGRAANWTEGTRISGYNEPPLEPGTALATFKHGKYENNPTGNHAGIFLGYEQRKGKDGFVLLEQMKNVRPRERFIEFNDVSTHRTTSQAQNYSVIRRLPTK